MNPLEAGFREGFDTSKPLPPETADGYYVEGFVKARIRAAREYERLPVGHYPLPCDPLEVEAVLNHGGPQAALRMIRPESLRPAV